MLAALLVIAALAIVSGAILGFASVRFRADTDPVVDRIDQLLPQTQCGQCTFPGCRPYAEAIADGRADINQCPPGGSATIEALADLLGRDAKPLDAAYGQEDARRVALIDEDTCIGCTLCIQACPVDAIVGAPRQMHTVIAAECTGCDLCLPPCPVDCIDMVVPQSDIRNWTWPMPRINPDQTLMDSPMHEATTP